MANKLFPYFQTSCESNFKESNLPFLRSDIVWDWVWLLVKHITNWFVKIHSKGSAALPFFTVASLMTLKASVVPPSQLRVSSRGKPKPTNSSLRKIVGSVANKLLFGVIIEVNNWKSLKYSLVISGTVWALNSIDSTERLRRVVRSRGLLSQTPFLMIVHQIWLRFCFPLCFTHCLIRALFVSALPKSRLTERMRTTCVHALAPESDDESALSTALIAPLEAKIMTFFTVLSSNFEPFLPTTAKCNRNENFEYNYRLEWTENQWTIRALA